LESSKKIWIATGVVSLLAVIIACVGFSLGGVLLFRGGEVESAPTPRIASSDNGAPQVAPAMDPVAATVLALGHDVISAARGVNPARPWFASPYGGEPLLVLSSGREAMSELGPAPEMVFVSLAVGAYPSDAIAGPYGWISAAIWVFPDGRLRYHDVTYQRGVNVDLVRDLPPFPNGTPSEQMLTRAIDRLVNGLAVGCTVPLAEDSDIASLPVALRMQIEIGRSPSTRDETCREVAANGAARYPGRTIVHVEVIVRGNGQTARLVSTFMQTPNTPARLGPVMVLPSPSI
jgi:hypothetical protein